MHRLIILSRSIPEAKVCMGFSRKCGHGSCVAVAEAFPLIGILNCMADLRKREQHDWIFFLLHLWRLRRYSSGERMIAFCLMGERGASSGKRYNLSIGAKCQICTRSTDTTQIYPFIIIFSPTVYLQFYRFYFNWSTILFYDFACLCWIKEVNFC